jgi:hypothetical protein
MRDGGQKVFAARGIFNELMQRKAATNFYEYLPEHRTSVARDSFALIRVLC